MDGAIPTANRWSKSQPFATTEKVMSCFSPWVKINWDVYHLQIMEGDLARRIREGFDEIGYIQIADNPGRNEPGTGEINYTRVFQELESLGYDKPVGLECWPVDGEAAAAERIRDADTW